MARRTFNTGEPLAYFLTWTTYGTWLPGDERTWQKKNMGGPRPPNRVINRSSQSKMQEKAFVLSTADRKVVENTIVRHCEIRSWQLHAISVRTNHAHVVVTAPCKPETVRNQLKAWCTRKLKPYHSGRERFWTEGASCRWINDEDSLENAIIYTVEVQDRKGLDEQI